MRLVFVYSDFGPGSGADGGTIFDRRLMQALSSFDGVVIEPFPIVRRRALRLPLWQARVEPAVPVRLAELKANGAQIVVSHEALFPVTKQLNLRLDPDLLIVHNFMCRFRFPGRPFLSAQYRAGSRRYFEQYLRHARGIIFLSRADYESAKAILGVSEEKVKVLAPPPRPAEIAERARDLIHLDGSFGWRAKRMSRLTNAEKLRILARGYRTGAFGDPMQSAFGLITDRFAVGYKLKLMQMLYARDVIASFVELEDDVRQVAPDYPCYRTVSSIEEALDFFDHYRYEAPPEHSMAASTQSLSKYTWEYVAEIMLSHLDAG